MTRVLLRIAAICAAFALPLSFVPRTAEDPQMPLEIGIEKTEAQLPEPGIPVRLRIDAIHLDAPIQPVGLLPDDKPDVPGSPNTVGWYEPNVRPGATGNAILDGHLDLRDGGPGVFWNLRHMNIGDVLEVEDAAGAVRSFRVVKMELYSADDAPMMDIFGPIGGKRLNIITCAGVWREELDHYDQRLVVYTELIE